MSGSNFLQKRKEELARTPNPCQLEVKFNGSKGTFHTYDRTILEKEDRKSKLTVDKKNPLRLVVLDMAKQISGYIPGKKGQQATNVGSNFFKDYKTDVVNVYVNGTPELSGLYSEIGEEAREFGGKVQDVYFCWSPTLGRPVTFIANGGKKTILRSAFKKKGGFSAAPFIQLSKGNMEETPSTSWYNLHVDIIDVEALTAKEIAEIDELGPQVVEYLSESIEHTNNPGVTEALDGMSTEDKVVEDDEFEEDFDDGEGLGL